MTAYVLDASVAAKWFLPAKNEPLANEAMALLSELRDATVRFAVPDLFWPELGNVLLKAARTGRIRLDLSEAALALARELPIITVPTKVLVSDALSIAAAFHRSIYEATYVSLALVIGSTLLTADERLANALSTRFPVRWLGSLA